MKRALIILASVLPFATVGILLSRTLPLAVIWYIASALIVVEVIIRLTSNRLGGIRHWTIEAIWIPYHCFLIYLFGKLLNLSQPALLGVSISVPLLMVGIVAATSKTQE